MIVAMKVREVVPWWPKVAFVLVAVAAGVALPWLFAQVAS